MDLVKAFTLFQANQIGELLDIKNIRDTLSGFDEDEVHVGTTDTNAGSRKALFLTELGLYRLLGMSRKPLARPFQKWVAKTIKEIRMTGKFELQEEAKRESQRVLDEEREARRLAEEKAIQLQAKLAGKYAPGQQIYVLMNPADANRNLYKLGRTKDLSKRIGNYNTGMPDGFSVLHTVTCADSAACEQVVATALEKFRYNREWYRCDLSIITNAMDAAVMANDGLVRCIDHLEKYGVTQKIAAMYNEIEQTERMLLTGRPPIDNPRPPSPEPRRAGLINWLTRRVRTPEPQPPQQPIQPPDLFAAWLHQNLVSMPGKRIHLHRLEKAFGNKDRSLVARLQPVVSMG